MWSEGRALELVDPSLGERSEVASIMRCIRVGLLCVQENATDRPTMAGVTAMLAATDGGATAALPDPTRPPYLSLRVGISGGGDGSEARARSHSTSCSTNELTITTIQEGR